MALEELVSPQYLIDTGWSADGSWFYKSLKEGIELVVSFNMGAKMIKDLWLRNKNHPGGVSTHSFYSRVHCPSKQEFEHLLELIQPELEDATKPIECFIIEKGTNGYTNVLHESK